MLTPPITYYYITAVDQGTLKGVLYTQVYNALIYGGEGGRQAFFVENVSWASL